MLAANATDIGNIVRRRRTKAALSQTELADKIGTSRKWIADLERGHPRAQLHLVLDVLNALDALVDIIDTPNEAPKGEDFAASAGGIDYLPTVRIPPELIRSIEQATKSLQLPPDTQRVIDRIGQLHTVNPEQMATIRKALTQVQIDEALLRATRRVSKELAQAEASLYDASHRPGSLDDDRDARRD